MSGTASAEIIRGSGNAQYNVSDGSGNVTDGGIIFRGEDDITLRNTTKASGNQIVTDSSLSRDAAAGGETLQIPVPQNQPVGRYSETENGGGFSVTVVTPRITTFDVNNNTTSINGGTLQTDQTEATVEIGFNFEDSERIDLIIVSENGVDVTNEFTSANTTINASVANNVREVDGTAGNVTIPFDPSGVDKGEYTFTAEGNDDFDFGDASQSTTIAVTAPKPQGEIDVSPSDLPGDGSESNPYEISNVSELQAMEDALTSNYVLVSDIDASQTPQFSNGSGFDPIGSADTAFTGSFDGDNHTITGLTINRSTENDVGLFGVVGNGAALADVTLTDVTVTGDGSVGTLAGENSGTIQNASTSGSVTGTDVVGGLVGRNQGGGIITDARSSVSTTGERNVGGLVGRNGDESRFGDQGIIANATASGSVNGEEDVGGLVGAAERAGTIRDTFAVGSVTGDTSVGGLVGENEGTVEDSYFDKQKTEQSSSAGAATGLATAQMQGQAATDNMGGLAFGVSWQPQTNPTDYPILIALQEADTIQQPIITLQSIDSNRTAITKGQTIKLTATVSNDGASDGTTQLAVIRNRDDQQLADSSFTIDGGATRTISVNVTPTQTETFSIQGPASTQSVTIDVADLNLVDVSLVTQEPVTTDETVIIDATVSNTGTTTGFIPLTLRQNEVVLNSTTPTEVPAGESVTQRLTGTLDEGTQNLTVTSGLTAQSATVGEVVVAPPGAITNATVRVGSESADPGETTDVNLTLDQAPAGLAGYNLTVSVNVAQTSGVRVAGASAPSVFNDSVTETTVGPNNQTVEIRATDIKTVVDENETNISLGTVTVAVNESVNVSQATFTVSISRISDDTGTPINVTTQNGTVSVNVSNQAPLADGLNSPTDLDGDGVFEDVNGNERLDFNDIVVLFENLPDAEAPFQDVNGNGRIDFDDIVELFQEI